MNIVEVLPAELVVRIFELVDAHTPAPNSHHAIPAAVILSHICAHWRSIALNDPLLWTKIWIKFRMDAYIQHVLTRVTVWLTRSKNAPIDVYIDVKCDFTDDDTVPCASQIVARTLNLLREHACRLRSLIFLFRDTLMSPPYYVISQLTDLDAPSLAGLQVYVPRAQPTTSFWDPGRLPRGTDQNLIAPNQPWPCFSAPKLQRIVLGPIYNPVGGVLPNVAHVEGWTQHMGPYDRTLPAIARKFPNVETLVLRYCTARMMSNLGTILSGITTVTIASLRFLSVSFAQVSCSSALKFAELPNLECLEYASEVRSDLWDVLPAPGAMPRLRKLCLTFFSMRPINAATKAYLRGLKTVEHLHLTHSPGDFIVPLSSAHMAPMSRRRSITALQDMSMADVRDVLNGTTTPAEDLLFPELHTVSLNTLKASDVAWLCNLVAVRAPRIRTVQLSSSAMRHLEGSLRRRGDKIETSPLTVLGSRRHAEDVQLPKDVGRWLRERVRVEAEEEHREGLHQLSRDVVDGIGITQEFTL